MEERGWKNSMERVNNLQDKAVTYFEKFDEKREIKFSREAARDICKCAIEYSIWIVGIDAGVLSSNGNYREDSDEGWITKTGLMSSDKLNNFKKRNVHVCDLKSNNLDALNAIDNISNELNAFIITGLKMSTYSK